MDTKIFVTDDIYRIYEVNHGILNEIAFIRSKESMKEYLESCNRQNSDKDIIYFAEKIKIEK